MTDVEMTDAEVADVEMTDVKDIKPSQIRGPISLIECTSLTFDKRIYLFGELHGHKPYCIANGSAVDVEDFIDHTITTSAPHVIDVYLEVPHAPYGIADSDSYQDSEQYIDRIYRKLQPCLHGHRHGEMKCPYPNTRIHAVDVRSILDPSSKIVALNNISYDIWIITAEEDKKRIVAKASSVANSLLSLFGDLKEAQSSRETGIPAFPSKNGLVDYKSFLQDRHLRKQLDSVSNEILTTLMLHLDIRMTKTDLTKANIRELKGMCELIVSSGADEMTMDAFIPDIKEINEKILHFSSHFVDIYTMARIFRSFRKVAGRYSRDPQRVIIYVGDSHARSCREILQVLGFTLVAQTYANANEYPIETPSIRGTSAQSCVDISSFKQPFFS